MRVRLCAWRDRHICAPPLLCCCHHNFSASRAHGRVEGKGRTPLDGWGGGSGLDTGHTSLGTTSTRRQARFHLHNHRTGVLQGVNTSEALRPAPHMWNAIPTGQRLSFASSVSCTNTPSIHVWSVDLKLCSTLAAHTVSGGPSSWFILCLCLGSFFIKRRY